MNYYSHQRLKPFLRLKEIKGHKTVKTNITVFWKILTFVAQWGAFR